MDANLNEIVIKLYEILATTPALNALILYSGLKLESIVETQIKKIKLTKENKFAHLKNIGEMPQILKKETQTIIPPSELQELINEFITTLSTSLNQEQSQIIKTNILNLKYKKENINSIIQMMRGTGGYYNPKNNTIAINKFSTTKYNKEKLKHILFHELLHAASTKNIDNEEFFSGFNQIINKNNHKYNIGIGINEGYTDYLATKFFNIDSNKTNVGYPYEVNIAQIIEFIVGEEKMKELYFNSDLKELCKELEKYEDKNNIKKFIVNLDTLTKYKRLERNNKKIEELETSIDLFLINIHKNKQNRNFNLRNNYNEDTLKSYLKEEDKFTTLFSKIEKHKGKYKDKKHIYIEYLKKQKEFLLSHNNNEQLKNNSKVRIKEKQQNGYVSIIILTAIITISTLLAILILKIK